MGKSIRLQSLFGDVSATARANGSEWRRLHESCFSFSYCGHKYPDRETSPGHISTVLQVFASFTKRAVALAFSGPFLGVVSLLAGFDGPLMVVALSFCLIS
jgi:hypothetical protein